MTHVIGLDLSLTSTGVASSLGWTDRIRPKHLRGLDRLRYILNHLRTYTHGCPLAVVEGPSYNHKGLRQHEELVALRWMVYDLLDRHDVPVAIAPPASVKLWATGKGNAGKTAVMAAMRDRYPDTAIASSDEADALALAEMGAAWTQGIAVTADQRRALNGVNWPALLSTEEAAA